MAETPKDEAISPDTPAAAALTKIFAENGLEKGGFTPHSWRCDHPDRYDCTCVEEIVADVLKQFRFVGAQPVYPKADYWEQQTPEFREDIAWGVMERERAVSRRQAERADREKLRADAAEAKILQMREAAAQEADLGYKFEERCDDIAKRIRALSPINPEASWVAEDRASRASAVQ